MASLKAFLALFVLGLALIVETVQGECFPAEVVLVLDDSESIRIFDKTTDSFTFAVDYSSVVRQLLAKFDSSTVRVSLVTYSQTAAALVGLTRNYRAITEEVDTYTREYSTQKTELGIDVAIKELDKARPETYKYMIVFLDGTSFQPDATRSSVIRAGEKNITLISVSLRGALEESYVIAGRSYRRFSVETPSELASRQDIIQGIADIVCLECKGYSDTIYLLDGSDSTRRVAPDFSSIFYAPGIVEFIVNVTRRVTMGPIRKGIISYSKTAQQVLGLTGNETAVIEAVRSLDPEYLNTLAGLAFKEANIMFDEVTTKRHQDTERIVVYMVDGTVTNKTDLTIEAKAVRDSGGVVFAVGFSPAAVIDDLLIAAGVQDNSYYARIASDLDMDAFVDPFVAFLCLTPSSLTTELTV